MYKINIVSYLENNSLTALLYVLIGRVSTNSVINLDLASAKTKDNQNIFCCEKCLLDHCVRPRRRQEEGGMYLTMCCDKGCLLSFDLSGSA